jgi:hypothetical protein
MERKTILDQIRRLTKANGSPPGRDLFRRETGLPHSTWYPQLWVRWGDALQEAGLSPNQLQARMSDDAVLAAFVALARELGRIPVNGELRVKARADASFPSDGVFRRFGGKAELLERVRAFAERESAEDLLSLLPPDIAPRGASRKVATGFVYLMKSGKHYKIGRTNSPNRRDRELKIAVPDSPKTLHSIETDDPPGVEAYWHRRFAEKRGEGEWFALTAEDVAAFKRWKRIV